MSDNSYQELLEQLSSIIETEEKLIQLLSPLANSEALQKFSTYLAESQTPYQDILALEDKFPPELKEKIAKLDELGKQLTADLNRLIPHVDNVVID